MCFQIQLQEKSLHSRTLVSAGLIDFLHHLRPDLTLILLGPSWLRDLSPFEPFLWGRDCILQLFRFTEIYNWFLRAVKEQWTRGIATRLSCHTWNTRSTSLPTGAWSFTLRKLWGLSFYTSPIISCLPQTQVFMVIYRQLKMSASWWRKSDF